MYKKKKIKVHSCVGNCVYVRWLCFLDKTIKTVKTTKRMLIIFERRRVTYSVLLIFPTRVHNLIEYRQKNKKYYDDDENHEKVLRTTQIPVIKTIAVRRNFDRFFWWNHCPTGQIHKRLGVVKSLKKNNFFFAFVKSIASQKCYLKISSEFKK